MAADDGAAATVAVVSRAVGAEVAFYVHVFACCTEAMAPRRRLDRMGREEVEGLVRDGVVALVSASDVRRARACGYCARVGGLRGGASRESVAACLERLGVPLSGVARRREPSMLGDLLCPERVVAEDNAFAELRRDVPMPTDLWNPDKSALCVRPDGAVEKSALVRALLHVLFYAARPRLGTPPALSRHAAGLFVELKRRPPASRAEEEEAYARATRAIVFMPPLRDWYRLFRANPACALHEMPRSDVFTDKLVIGARLAAVRMALDALEDEAGAPPLTRASSPAFLAALRRVPSDSQAALVVCYVEVYTPRQEKESELLARLSSRLQRDAGGCADALAAGFDRLVWCVSSMFQAGEVGIGKPMDRYVCLMAAFEGPHRRFNLALRADEERELRELRAEVEGGDM
jgi:hypothetical protein